MDPYIISRHDGPIELMLALASLAAFAWNVLMTFSTFSVLASSGLCFR
jgi:hypothetical protein